MLLLVMGGGIGMFNCLYTVMQQLLCTRGYSNGVAGACAALMITGGICGSAASSIFSYSFYSFLFRRTAGAKFNGKS
ncbi:unnamed protein product [Gongylonema pulchrum]|uniref:MFS transporter n=1 Tax=Gongylonema pulchrum TaxID=637853 RepID=A0A183DJ52_9BILA|nr:unnamed protein product [Gongylonema pulchrum]